jgi:hypothetical protein
LRRRVTLQEEELCSSKHEKRDEVSGPDRARVPDHRSVELSVVGGNRWRNSIEIVASDEDAHAGRHTGQHGPDREHGRNPATRGEDSQDTHGQSGAEGERDEGRLSPAA